MKSDIIAALRRHIAQRSGMEFRNYWTSDHWNARSEARRAFMRDYRPMLKDGALAREMLREIELRDSITADDLLAGFREFSGRLTYDADRKRCDYCTGQYFPTEYRRAAVVVLASVLYDYIKRDTCDIGCEGWRKRFERNVRLAFPRRIARIVTNL